MPHSAASGACSVYQAWWARKKLPGPEVGDPHRGGGAAVALAVQPAQSGPVTA